MTSIEMAEWLDEEREARARVLAVKDRWFRWETRFLYFVAIGLAAYVALLAGRIERVSQEQIKGRAIGSDVTCAFGSAVADAGRRTIMASARAPTTEQGKRYVRGLEALGGPSLSERQQAAELGGRAYVESIAKAVENYTGLTGIVVKEGRRAGTLDCVKLREATKVDR